MSASPSGSFTFLERFDYRIFGCGPREYNCTKSPKDVPDLSDIDGLGIVIAFSATSVFTLLSIAFAYIFDVIPQVQESEVSNRPGASPGLVNDLDGYVIERFQHICRLKKLSQRAKRRIDGFRSLQRFMLALSDQQIVTGLAIFIIGFSKHCELSSYHFIVIMALGWFSFTTHLSTLSVLQGHLAGRPGQKVFRLLGIIVTYLLLSISLVVLYSRFNNDIDVQCKFGHLGLSGATPLRYTCAILLLIFLGTMFLSKCARFCFSRHSDLSSLRRMVWRLFSKIRPKGQYRRDYFEMKINSLDCSSNPQLLRSLHRFLLSFAYVLLEYLDSFCWELSWLSFSNFYGIRQIWWAREYVGAKVVSPEVRAHRNSSSFGQILALLLLAIPILVGIEAIQDSKRTDLLAGEIEDGRVAPSDQGQEQDLAEQTPFSRRFSSHEAESFSRTFYRTPNFRLIFAGVFIYTQATLCTVAYTVGGPIIDETAPSVKAAIYLSLILLLATIWPFFEEVRARNYAKRDIDCPEQDQTDGDGESQSALYQIPGRSSP